MVEAVKTTRVQVVWNFYNDCAKTSRGMAEKARAARAAVLWMGFAAAILGAASGQATIWLGTREHWVTVALGLGAAIALATASYLGTEILKPDRLKKRANARTLAEALKREVYLYLFRVPPYDGADPEDKLEARAEEFRQNTKLGSFETTTVEERRKLPDSSTIEAYLQGRLENQIDYYRRTAAKYQKKLKGWRRTSFVMGLLAVIFGLSAVERWGLPVWVPVMTTAVAAVGTYIQSGRFHAQQVLYQATALQLSYRLARWNELSDAERTPEETVALVRESEDIMARENGAWLAEWESADED